MKRNLSFLPVMLTLLCLLALAPALAEAQPPRAYAPENLRTLSYNDQVRVISLEYEEQSGGRRIPDDQLRFYLDQVNRSNWGFSRIKSDIAQSLRGSAPPPSSGTQTMRCESTDGRGRTCRTPWPGHSRLVRQLSRGDCVEGRTWQSQRGQVFVSNGCRGEFAEAHDAPGAGGNRVVCESSGSRPKTCPTPWRGSSRLERQLSNAPCTQGRTWGSSRGEVWVDDGCRGVFGPGQGQGWGPGGRYSVTCVASGPGHTTCAWDRSQGRPYVMELLSTTRCVERHNWGYDDRVGLWVSGGCRARFGAR